MAFIRWWPEWRKPDANLAADALARLLTGDGSVPVPVRSECSRARHAFFQRFENLTGRGHDATSGQKHKNGFGLASSRVIMYRLAAFISEKTHASWPYTADVVIKAGRSVTLSYCQAVPAAARPPGKGEVVGMDGNFTWACVDADSGTDRASLPARSTPMLAARRSICGGAHLLPTPVPTGENDGRAMALDA